MKWINNRRTNGMEILIEGSVTDYGEKRKTGYHIEEGT
jgi:hypothetical protein